MNNTRMKIFVIVAALIVSVSCSNDEEESMFSSITENDFGIMPSNPSSKDEISIITNDCAYNQLDEIIMDGFTIEIVKHFNSMMKQPCVMEKDTIQLGKLSAGTYQIKFTIVDISTNILASDSIFSTVSKHVFVAD